MSRMGNYNLQLQEQAEELGFSTTQEALDNGYHVVEDLVTGEATLKELSVDEQYELAHEAWLKEKEEVLFDLKALKKEMDYIGMNEWIESVENAIKFIEGVSHE